MWSRGTLSAPTSSPLLSLLPHLQAHINAALLQARRRIRLPEIYSLAPPGRSHKCSLGHTTSFEARWFLNGSDDWDTPLVRREIPESIAFTLSGQTSAMEKASVIPPNIGRRLAFFRVKWRGSEKRRRNLSSDGRRVKWRVRLRPANCGRWLKVPGFCPSGLLRRYSHYTWYGSRESGARPSQLLPRSTRCRKEQLHAACIVRAACWSRWSNRRMQSCKLL